MLGPTCNNKILNNNPVGVIEYPTHLGGSPPFLMSSDRTPLIIGGDSAGHGCILYALVSRGSTILAEESLGSRRKAVGGNFATVA